MAKKHRRAEEDDVAAVWGEESAATPAPAPALAPTPTPIAAPPAAPEPRVCLTLQDGRTIECGRYDLVELSTGAVHANSVQPGQFAVVDGVAVQVVDVQLVD